MLTILLMLALAINGGLYAGTIMYSACKCAKMTSAIGFKN